MGCVCFSVPVVLGYYGATWAISQSEATLHERFGRGRHDDGDNKEVEQQKKIEGIGDKRIITHGDNRNDGEPATPQVVTVGAGGWGGGVHLATSDQETQDVNRINLERFMKKQLKEKKKRERLQAKQQQ